ncbi:MAG: thioesterase family protein [Brucellaceae bacterium]|nr:thioesterase family protein [Brucellaceae bacterium]
MRSYDDNKRATTDRPQAHALLTLEASIPADWIDYNGHMTEWQYYKLMADSGESFLRIIGFSEEYRLQGFSFFSVEGHQRNLRECRVGTPLKVYTEVLGFDDIRLHLYSYVIDTVRDIVVCTGEHMMLHVDTNRRKATPFGPYIRGCLVAAITKWPAPLRPLGMSSSVREIASR